MNVQALRRAAQSNHLALKNKGTNSNTAAEQLKKWGSTGSGATKR